MMSEPSVIDQAYQQVVDIAETTTQAELLRHYIERCAAGHLVIQVPIIQDEQVIGFRCTAHIESGKYHRAIAVPLYTVAQATALTHELIRQYAILLGQSFFV